MSKTVFVLTQIPSPYQVELFDAVWQRGTVDIRVAYLCRSSPVRQWASPTPRHPHVYLSDGVQATALSSEWCDSSTLCVFTWYTDARARRLIRRRHSSAKPWCYWGERPGFRFGGLGRLPRRFLLGPLHRSAAPIWGIGSWAVDGWRREFGNERRYETIPYFSNLTRYSRAGPPRRGATRTVLYSGSLIARKGCDLLAAAFARVAQRHPHLRLDVLGSGPLEADFRRAVSPVAGRVRFLGFRQWEELPEHYRSADVLCAPSRYDGWGLIVPEGLAAGLPVIATDRMGAALDLLKPGVNGWMTRAGSSADLESALEDVAVADSARLDEMSRAAAASVSGHGLSDGAALFSDAAFRAVADHQRRITARLVG